MSKDQTLTKPTSAKQESRKGLDGTPCSDGFYWWRRSQNHEWELSKVVAHPFLAKFYDGSRISSHPLGEWRKAEVSDPNTIGHAPEEKGTANE
jgi:hypothetical protein